MTFYLVHTRISYAVNSICAHTRLCSRKRAMTREGVDLDMKLPSILREVFKYENKYIFLQKNCPGSFKLTLQTVVSCQDQPLPLSLRAFATESSLRAFCYRV